MAPNYDPVPRQEGLKRFLASPLDPESFAYLDKYGVFGDVNVATGAWNTGWHHGHDFLQWTGSMAQQEALARVRETSHAVHDARWRAGTAGKGNAGLEQAMHKLLRAETSCNYFWGEAWVPRAHQDMDASWASLAHAGRELNCVP